MGAHILAGIAGQKLDLRFSPNGCIASVPGHGPIANLMLNTTDALLTPSGMLVHRDAAFEVRMMQIPDGKTIYHKSTTIVSKEDAKIPAPPIPTTGTIPASMIEHAKISAANALTTAPGTVKLSGGTISAGGVKIGTGVTIGAGVTITREPTVLGRDDKELVFHAPPDGTRTVTLDNWIKTQVEQMVREQVSRNMEKLQAEFRRELAALRTEKAQTAVRIERDAEERSWGNQGGLPNFLAAVDDNPFARRK